LEIHKTDFHIPTGHLRTDRRGGLTSNSRFIEGSEAEARRDRFGRID
jgi:hypothetical protein